MEQKVNLDKEVYPKRQYEQVINTSFSQLVPPSESVAVDQPPTVEEFFQDYDTLFFQIPKTGATNSHEYLIQQSSEYIGYVPQNEEIIALTEEITALRNQLIDSRQQLSDLANGGSN